MEPIAGTEGVVSAFFSPDGQWLGFIAGGKLRKMPVRGGAALPICDATDSFGTTWLPDDTIVFSERSALYRVSSEGGQPHVLLQPSAQGPSYQAPEALPGGRTILFTRWQTSAEDAEVAAYSLESGSQKTLLRRASVARYAAGHLVISRLNSLWAVPFDLSRVEVTGAPVSLDIEVTGQVRETGSFDVSPDGTLVYWPGELPKFTLVWLDRAGRAAPLDLPARAYRFPRVSPDGAFIAVEVADTINRDIWIHDIRRATFTRLTLAHSNREPVWVPGTGRIIYSSNASGTFNLISKSADGSGPEEQLYSGPQGQLPCSVSSDRKFVAYQVFDRKDQWDIWLMPLDGDRKPRPFQKSPSIEVRCSFSPDSRWLPGR